jgi:hypothetical protein
MPSDPVCTKQSANHGAVRKGGSAMKKNTFTRLLVTALAIAMIVTTPILSSAANTDNSTLPSSFISYTTNATTGVRNKTNTTSVYMKNESGMTLWVYANGGSKPTPVPLTYSTSTTIGGHANVAVGRRAVRTLIYENGYRSAWLNISTAATSVSGNLAGAWSPDSTGAYTPAN